VHLGPSSMRTRSRNGEQAPFRLSVYRLRVFDNHLHWGYKEVNVWAGPSIVFKEVQPCVTAEPFWMLAAPLSLWLVSGLILIFTLFIG